MERINNVVYFDPENEVHKTIRSMTGIGTNVLTLWLVDANSPVIQTLQEENVPVCIYRYSDNNPDPKSRACLTFYASDMARILGIMVRKGLMKKPVADGISSLDIQIQAALKMEKNMHGRKPGRRKHGHSKPLVRRVGRGTLHYAA